MPTLPKKILYIGGYSRCGSTLLSNVLNEVDSFFNAGELMYIWDRIISEEGICGCGDHLTHCRIWGNIIRDAFGEHPDVDCSKMIKIRNRIWKSRNIPLWMWYPEKGKNLITETEDYLEKLKALYFAIGNALSEKIIIDASKNPAYLYLLSLISEIDLYVVHIVRDSRATAYSWMNKKSGFPVIKPWRSSLSWNARNSAFDLLKRRFRGKYIQIRYEDFISDPKRVLQSILTLLGEKGKSLDFLEPDGMVFGRNHCVYGNPDLFKKGKIKLKLDERWRNMDVREKLVTTSLTWPLAIRYGYHIHC